MYCELGMSSKEPVLVVYWVDLPGIWTGELPSNERTLNGSTEKISYGLFSKLEMGRFMHPLSFARSIAHISLLYLVYLSTPSSMTLLIWFKSWEESTAVASYLMYPSFIYFTELICSCAVVIDPHTSFFFCLLVFGQTILVQPVFFSSEKESILSFCFINVTENL